VWNVSTFQIHVTKRKEFFEYLTDPGITVLDITFPTSIMAVLTVRDKDGFTPPNPHVNVILAAFTTSHARLHLYKALAKLGGRVLYCDTDSVFYTLKRGEKRLPGGPYVGQLTDEIAKEFGPDAYIHAFVSVGAKTYSYEVRNRRTGERIGETVVKAKGFCLSHTNSKRINFKSLRAMAKAFLQTNDALVMGEDEEVDKPSLVQTLTYPVIRARADHSLVSRMETKKLRVVFDKRVIVPTDSIKCVKTIPHGYVV
jgi:hypothetical protein